MGAALKRQKKQTTMTKKNPNKKKYHATSLKFTIVANYKKYVKVWLY